VPAPGTASDHDGWTGPACAGAPAVPVAVRAAPRPHAETREESPVSRASRHRFQGAPERFRAVADFIAARYGRSVRTIADVAGGQGMLARILAKRYGYTAEVFDPRPIVLRGVAHRAVPFDPADAPYYDLIVGLHPDQATRAVAVAARARPAVLIPCCNCWAPEHLGQEALLRAIEADYDRHGVAHERVRFAFAGPKHVGLVSRPSGAAGRGGAGA
jgi:hypothetical protein